MASSPARKAVIVGISGCSSSGKTTLARLLRDLFPGSFILHEDDFYKIDKDIPIGVDGMADWDCPESIAVPDMTKALAYIRAHGVLPVSLNPSLSRRTDHGRRRGGDRRGGGRGGSSNSPAAPSAVLSQPLPGPPSGPPPAPSSSLSLTPSPQPDLVSKEDKNDVGTCPVSDAALAAVRARVDAWLQPGQPGHFLVDVAAAGPRLCFLDGFLLYCPELRPVMDLIDVRLFLRVSRARATQRRAARSGYVTLEGFWQDPPGYMEKIVWPNYVATHRWLFSDGDDGDGDVEGPPNAATLTAHRIHTQMDRGPDVDMETTLAWTVETLLAELGHHGEAA